MIVINSDPGDSSQLTYRSCLKNGPHSISGSKTLLLRLHTFCTLGPVSLSDSKVNGLTAVNQCSDCAPLILTLLSKGVSHFLIQSFHLHFGEYYVDNIDEWHQCFFLTQTQVSFCYDQQQFISEILPENIGHPCSQQALKWWLFPSSDYRVICQSQTDQASSFLILMSVTSLPS